ncbi:MAG TPA: diphosphomevalonate decarboxylase [Polyangia bacterium]|nr:diphosphomevalonate decarboxylase [Polyangia bacterium]
MKYFGKRNARLNLPAAGSLSIALEPLETVTAVEFSSDFTEDLVVLGNGPAPVEFTSRVVRFIDLVREQANSRLRARVETHNSFPTGAGIASSASGFAALALAASSALGLELSGPALSALARRGSGSAARSVPGGLALWQAGTAGDGADSFARRVLGPEDWDLRLVVGVVDPEPKAVGSTDGMEHTRKTSPFYEQWVRTAAADLEAAVEAVAARDLERLGTIAEDDALAMHAAALAARPAIAYLKGPTLDGLRLARELRAAGVGAWWTCDAGPQPKLLCGPADEPAVARSLGGIPGVREVLRCHLGGGVELVRASAVS